MPIRTSRMAVPFALVGMVAGAVIQVPYSMQPGDWTLYVPFFYFLILGSSTFASLGCLIALVFGGSLSRRVCWLFGLACGYLAPELLGAIVVKIDDIDIYHFYYY